jgi:hypothetical protein
MQDDPPLSVGADWDAVVAACGPLVTLWASVDLTLSARRAAVSLGLRDSNALREWLRERRLPPYLTLRNWYYVVRLLEVSERGSLARWALDGVRDPATYYRFAKRTTGMTWTAIWDEGPLSIRTRALAVWQPLCSR